MMPSPFKDSKDNQPTTAREIADAEKAKRDAITARLRAARLAKEVDDSVKPAIKTRKKRRWAPK